MTHHDFDLPVRADVGRWLGQVVSVLAASRCATWVDLREQLGEPDGSKRFKRLVQDYLPRTGLAVTEVARVFGRRHWLGLIRLTERGKDLARAQGVEPLENDWERVIRLHQGEAQAAHAGLLLAFDLRARRRGWMPQVLPEVSPPSEGFAPDLWIERDGVGLYVEVEGKYHHANAAKWQAARRAQGFAAIVACTPSARATLVEDCQASGVAGIATDFHRLYYRPTATLWAEAWSATFTPPELMDRLRALVGVTDR
ncbi:MAG: hypothetical protein KA765_10210 [Thermoflexales bacterium]|nr:hypothetical protein [Thermoflexales bacterium]